MVRACDDLVSDVCGEQMDRGWSRAFGDSMDMHIKMCIRVIHFVSSLKFYSVGSSMPTTKVTNISGMSGMTRSRHVFTPPELPAGSKDKGKANENVVEREKISLVMKTETPIKKLTKKEDNSGKKEISAREATEFLKIIQ